MEKINSHLSDKVKVIMKSHSIRDIQDDLQRSLKEIEFKEQFLQSIKNEAFDMSAEAEKLNKERQRLLERKAHVEEKQRNQEEEFKKIEETRDEIRFRTQQILNEEQMIKMRKGENQELLKEIELLENKMRTERNEALKGQLIVEITQKQELYFRDASQIKRLISENNASRQTLRQQMGFAQRQQMYFFEYQEFISIRIKELGYQL